MDEKLKDLCLLSRETERLREGVALHSFSYTRGEGGLPVKVWVAEIAPGAAAVAVQNAPWGTTRTVADHMKAAQRRGKNPILATNADFFHLAAGTLTPYGMQVVDGVVIYEPHTRERYGNLWFGITCDGAPVIGDCESYFNEYQGRLAQGVGAGVVLLKKGEICAEDSDSTGPRTWVGYSPDGRVTLAISDGRQPDWSVGVCLREQAQILLDFGMTEAINLDGGGSTVMTVRDPDGTFRNVNRPCVTPERPVADVLMIAEP